MKIAALVIIFLMLVISLFRPEPGKKTKDETPTLPKQPKPVNKKPQLIDKKPTYHSSLTALLSEQIQAVYYVLVNHSRHEISFPQYDAPDQAVLFQLSNGKWLNWVWEEEGLHGRPEFQLSFLDKRKTLGDRFSQLVKVSDEKNWQPFIGKPLQSFHLQFEKMAKDESYLAELHLNLGSGKVVLRATEEPDSKEKVDPTTLPFANDWILVHFMT